MSGFANDGSFMQQFLAKQQAGGAAYPPVDPTAMYANYGYGNGAPAGPYGNPYGGYQPQGGFHNQQQQQRPDEVPSRSLWVGNLPQDISESEVRREFSMYGMIDHVKLLLHKNCCFVNYAELDSSINAFTNGRGKMINGQTLRVGYGKSDPNREDRQEKHEPCKNLWVGNLSERAVEEDLRREFEPYGRIDRVKVLPHKNCGFVNFSSIAEATRARNALVGRMMYDRPLRINYGKDDGGRGREAVKNKAPPFGYAPSDKQLHRMISETAAMILRRNLDVDMFIGFVELQNQSEEKPQLSFLLGGEGSEYFRWTSHCLKANIPDNQFFPHLVDRRQQQMNLTPADRKEISDILSGLTGTRESIKSATDWISQHSYTVPDVVSLIDVEINGDMEYEKKLFIFYVVNDVLGYCSAFRNPQNDLDPICSTFKKKMVSILRAVHDVDDEEKKETVLKVLRMWGEKNYYDAATIEHLESQMKSDGPIQVQEEEELPPWLQPENNPQPSSYGSYGTNQFHSSVPEDPSKRQRV